MARKQGQKTIEYTNNTLKPGYIIEETEEKTITANGGYKTVRTKRMVRDPDSPGSFLTNLWRLLGVVDA